MDVSPVEVFALFGKDQDGVGLALAHIRTHPYGTDAGFARFTVGERPRVSFLNGIGIGDGEHVSLRGEDDRPAVGGTGMREVPVQHRGADREGLPRRDDGGCDGHDPFGRTTDYGRPDGRARYLAQLAVALHVHHAEEAPDLFLGPRLHTDPERLVLRIAIGDDDSVSGIEVGDLHIRDDPPTPFRGAQGPCPALPLRRQIGGDPALLRPHSDPGVGVCLEIEGRVDRFPGIVSTVRASDELLDGVRAEHQRLSPPLIGRGDTQSPSLLESRVTHGVGKGEGSVGTRFEGALWGHFDGAVGAVGHVIVPVAGSSLWWEHRSDCCSSVAPPGLACATSCGIPGDGAPGY